MKICKVKTFIVCLVLAALLCCAFVTGVGFAETDQPSGAQANNFVYTAEFDPSEGATLFFGATATDRWQVKVDVDTVVLSRVTQQEGETAKEVTLKSAEVAANGKVTLVVNEGVCKVFAGDSKVAAIVCRLVGYNGGLVGASVNNAQLNRTDASSGHFSCGYEVIKVVNVTDNHAVLKDADYKVEKGVLTLAQSYLNTLENGVSYTFRAVTSFTDFDFVVTPIIESAVHALPTVDKFYRGNDVVLQLSDNAKVDNVTMDGNAVAFTVDDGLVVLKAEAIKDVTAGTHKVGVFTDRGRITVDVVLADAVVTITELEEKASHAFFWVDIAIFGSLILGYGAFSLIKKNKKH